MKPLFNNIVAMITGSDASILAAKYAIVMAKTYHCKLYAVYVVDTATIKQLTLSKIFIQEEGQDYERSLEANGERYLSFVEELAKAKGVKVDKRIRRGAVYTEMLAVADDVNADMIVIGGWEKDRSSKDIFSHSYREIMINAKCSVIYVKEPDIDHIYKQA
ncbi:MAG: universal stress protein [Treponema sp.]|nr:universal stress protein [Treponema sp.]